MLRCAVEGRGTDKGMDMKRLELAIENIILASRWLLVVFYLGLMVALAFYGVAFIIKLLSFIGNIAALDDQSAVMRVLGLIDAALVASLVVMVIIAGYENFVSRFDRQAGEDVAWLGKIDFASLKLKVAATIVLISSIHLLQIFLNATEYDNYKLLWYTVIHLAFVVSALLLAVIDRLAGKKSE